RRVDGQEARRVPAQPPAPGPARGARGARREGPRAERGRGSEGEAAACGEASEDDGEDATDEGEAEPPIRVPPSQVLTGQAPAGSGRGPPSVFSLSGKCARVCHGTAPKSHQRKSAFSGARRNLREDPEARLAQGELVELRIDAPEVVLPALVA